MEPKEDGRQGPDQEKLHTVHDQGHGVASLLVHQVARIPYQYIDSWPNRPYEPLGRIPCWFSQKWIPAGDVGVNDVPAEDATEEGQEYGQDQTNVHLSRNKL